MMSILKKLARAPFVFSLLLAVAACAQPLPMVETQSYAAAIESMRAAATPLIDELAERERRNGADAARSAYRKALNLPPGTPANGYILPFAAEQAVFFVPNGDPPLARSMRLAIDSLLAYGDALRLLAGGNRAEEAKSQLALAGTNAQALATMGGIGLSPVVPEVFHLFQEALGKIVQAHDAEEFRTLVLNGNKAAKDAVAALQGASPLIFDHLIGLDREEWARNRLRRNAEAVGAAHARIEVYRQTMAGFVILLQGIDNAIDRLGAANARPASPATLQIIAADSSRLLVDAELLRRALIANRTLAGGRP